MTRLRLLAPLACLLLLRPTPAATATHHHQGDHPAMTLISRPMLAPVISGTSTTPDHGVRRPEGIVRVRRTAQAVQEAPEAADPTEDTPDAAEAAQDATDTAPATRADVARLEGLVLQLLARDEERAATIARLEDVALSVLLDLDTLRQRVESWRAEDAERADY